MKIRVIDSGCGTGKTTWAINYMRQNAKHKRFIFITPFLNQIKRAIEQTDIGMLQPKTDDSNFTKYSHLLSLISQGQNIAITHSLFQLGDQNLIDLLQVQDYELILDEVLEVISTIDIPTGVRNFFIQKEAISIDKYNIVHLTERGKKIQLEGAGKAIDNAFKLIQTNRVISITGNFFLWLFPVELLQHFNNIIIMTYMFDNQTMCNYLKVNNAQFTYYHTEYNNGDVKLIDGKCPYSGAKYKDLINIYDGKLNSIGKKSNYMSSSWYSKRSNKKYFKILSNNAFNYLLHIVKTKSDKVMWTCPKNSYDNGDVAILGCKKSFVVQNQRATNDYKYKTTLVYLSNRYQNPLYYNYFKQKGLFIDNNIFALSQMIQWIFRSAIRQNQPINIYIPSKRMRQLLQMWLNDQIENLIK